MGRTGLNLQMRTFSALCMLLIVVAHVNSAGFNGPFDLFPPYTFHVAAFVFVSGYFYKERYDEAPLDYIKGRFERLVVPVFLINIAYGVLVTVLRHAFGFTWGSDLSVRNVVLGPFIDGHQFNLNLATWFAPVLFYAEAVHVLLRWATRGMRSKRPRELAIICAFLALGAFAFSAGVDGEWFPSWRQTLGRTCFFLAAFGLGRAYALLEPYDTLPDLPYFGIVLGVQLVLLYLARNDGGFAIPSWNRYPNGIVRTYLLLVNGIAFYLRLAKLLAPAVGESRLVSALGGEGFSIMCHHRTGFFIVCAAQAIVAALTPLNNSFDWDAFYSESSYYFMPNGVPQFALVYVAFGIAFSLAVHAAWNKLRRRIGGVRASAAPRS